MWAVDISLLWPVSYSQAPFAMHKFPSHVEEEEATWRSTFSIPFRDSEHFTGKRVTACAFLLRYS